MTFPYTNLPHGFRRPIIRIVVSYKGRQVPYFALIDSGADMNLMHAELAPLLGIDLEEGERRDIGGIVDAERRPFYLHRVTLHVGNRAHPDVEVGFMPSLSKTGHGLLGQYGFFDLYRVGFDLPKGEIDLVEIGG
jgi:hypothetical protein